jgi:hypothetical protein
MRIRLTLGLLLVWIASAFAQQPTPAIHTVPHSGTPPPDLKLAPNSHCEFLPWKLDNNSTNHVTSWDHSRTFPVASVIVYFSPGGTPAAMFPVSWSWSIEVTGNPVTIELTEKKLNLHIYSGAPLHGSWNGFSSGWSIYSSGYWAAVLCSAQ